MLSVDSKLTSRILSFKLKINFVNLDIFHDPLTTLRTLSANPTLMMSINQLLTKFRNGQQNVIRKTRNLPRRFVVVFFLFRSQNRFCFLFANEPVHDLWHISFWISANQMFYPQIPSTPIRLAIKFQFKLLCWSGRHPFFRWQSHSVRNLSKC